jgi:DNA-binding NarL/FixJ family response regulator
MTGIVVVDDHPIVREGLRQLLRAHPDFTIVGEADQAS